MSVWIILKGKFVKDEGFKEVRMLNDLFKNMLKLLGKVKRFVLRVKLWVGRDFLVD